MPKKLVVWILSDGSVYENMLHTSIKFDTTTLVSAGFVALLDVMAAAPSYPQPVAIKRNRSVGHNRAQNAAISVETL
jgi:hypothetical protein